jgi:triacylglycerol lipase
MRPAFRPFAAAALGLLAACGSITDPSDPSALAARRPKPPKTPILFVHGFNSSAGIWTTMMGRFQKDGWTAGRLAAFTYNSDASNVTTAGIIKAKVDSIQAATGAPTVAIVGHSMGTLSARYYIKNLGGGTDVSAFISLAGANHGTNIAAFCFTISCREMVPGSAFLTSLNADDETPGAVSYRTWWSSCDDVISPRTSMLLAGATNTQTACLEHSQMYTDATVYGQVREFVNQSATATLAVYAN